MITHAWLPSTVRVLHLEYDIQYFTQGENDGLDGQCLIGKQIIKLSPVLASVQLFETLLHEINHALNHIADLTDQCSEEDHVRRATPLWLCIWRDNPQLLILLNRYAAGEL